MRQSHQPADHREWLYTQSELRANAVDCRCAIARQQDSEQPPRCAAIAEAQHILNLRRSNLALTLHVGVGNRLVEDG